MLAGLIYNGTVAMSVILMGSFGTAALLLFLGRNLILREPQPLIEH